MYALYHLWIALQQQPDKSSTLGRVMGRAGALAQLRGQAWRCDSRVEVHRRLVISSAVAPSATQNWAALIRFEEPIKNLQ